MFPLINLIRYLVVLRVNHSMVRVSESLSAEMSLILGTAISKRLPTAQAGPWKKTLASWDEYGGTASLDKKKTRGMPEQPWPMQATIFAYPGKRTYGTDELVFWEIKLLKNDADHGLFLELILPALEELGTKITPKWKSSNSLWSRFDIHSVYAARGSEWEPFVRDGRLDLDYKPTPSQWSDGLVMDRVTKKRTLDKLTWMSAFDLSEYETGSSVNLRNRSPYTGPSLKQILEAFLGRMGSLISGKPTSPDDAMELLSAKAQSPLKNAIEKAVRIPVISNNIQYADSSPGRWTGSQIFATSVPDMILFYLNLASIFHIGKYTHYGCGTFILE